MKKYLLNIRQLDDEKLFHIAYEKVDAKRQNKIDVLRKDEAKKASLGAGLLLQYAFTQMGMKDKLGDIVFTTKGKPYLANGEIYFNISHSGELVLCVVDSQNIGCDIEKTRNNVPKHLTKILSEEELEQYKTLSEKDKIQWFFKLWTIKESIGKHHGSGLAFPFSDVTIWGSSGILEQIKYKEEVRFLQSLIYKNYMLGICSTNRTIDQDIEYLEISDIIDI